MTKLTAKQQSLLDKITTPLRVETALAYILSGYDNQTLAYLSACKTLGKKPAKNPETSASEILSYPNVQAFIDSVKFEAAQTVNIDAAWVLSQAVKLHNRCMQAEKVTMPNGDPMLDEDGEPVYKFEHAGAAKSLEIVGKHISVRAFEVAEARASDSLADSVGKLIDKLPN